MLKLKGRRGEHQALTAEGGTKKTVMPAIAVIHITDDGVKHMLEVSSQLVPSSLAGMQLDVRIAGRGVPAYGAGDFKACQALVVGPCRARGSRYAGGTREGMIDETDIAYPAAHQRLVRFPDEVIPELPGEDGSAFTVAGKEQDSGGWTIKTMNGVNPTAESVAHQLQGEKAVPAA